jgi:hypothetical protein
MYLDTVYCFDADSGIKLWSYRTGGSVQSSPAVSDGKLYVGCNDKKVYCLDAVTGALIWNTTTGETVGSSPAVAHGRVYVGSHDEKLYCLDASTGTVLWTYTTGSYVVSSPAVADDKVYFGSYDENVYCLDAFTGTELWRYRTGYTIFSSPAVAGEMVFIGSWDTKMYAFGTPSVTYSVEVEGTSYPVIIKSNSIISEFSFDQASKTISIHIANAAGMSGSAGFCNITFPNELLGGPYTLLFDDSELPFSQSSNATHTSLFFNYTHSTHTIEVVGTTVIPEISSIITVSIFFTTALLVLINRKRLFQEKNSKNQ